MLLSKDAIADVVEILKTGDFYRPVHATVFDAILTLYGRGEPADPITVSAALSDSGDLGRIGGAPYLHTLIASVPTAANASYYARIVSERAVLRRLVEAGTRIVQLGYGSAAGGGRDVDDIVDLAQQAVYDITERRVSEDFAVLADMLQPTLDEIEAVGAHGGMMTGVPTGFSDLDRLLNGLHPGQLIIVAGRPGLGKALALDTPVPTPSGWTTMGAIQAGDLVIGADGKPATVTRAFEVMHDRPCFEVRFCDGSTITADADHLWAVTGRAGDAAERPVAVPAVLTTAEVAAALRHPTDGRRDLAVRNSRALDLPHRDDLIIAPYPMGVWLGAGCAPAGPLTGSDPELTMFLEADGFTIGPGGASTASRGLRCAPGRSRYGSFAGSLRAAGVDGEEHIPSGYLRAAEPQRRALLAGLLDAAGTVGAGGDVELRAPCEAVATGAHELIVGLGYRCTISRRAVNGRGVVPSTAFVVTFSTVDDVFRLARKRLIHKERRQAVDERRIAAREVADVRRVPSVPVRCITVDNADHLYLAGRSMIPTHNSTASMDFARHAAIRHNCASAIFSLEMSKIEIVMRLLSAEARVPLHVLRSGQLSDDDWTKLARRMGEISEAPIFVDDTPSMNLMEIRAKARRLKQRHDLKLIVVDYLQLMTSPKRTESRQQEVADLSRGLKLLAKEVECPVIAVSQLNRGPEQRTDKRPQLSDLRESGCLTASTRVIRADDNSEVTLGELMASGARDVPVWALDERLRYTPRTLTHAFPSGRRQTYRLGLASGKRIEATANHPFLTFGGWVPLARLAIGDRLGTPRHIPGPLATRSRVEPELVMLAHLLGAGSFGAGQPIRYAGGDEENRSAVASAAKHFGITAVTDNHAGAGSSTLRLPDPHQPAGGPGNPVAAWLDGFGLLGRPSPDMFVPGAVFGLPKDQVALFLRHLWAAAGSVAVGSADCAGRVCFRATSRRLVDDISRLLLRFGVTASISTAGSERQPGQYTLEVSDRDDQLRFLREVGVHGQRSSACADLIAQLEATRTNTGVDAVPTEVWGRVREILVDSDHPRKPPPARPGLARIAAVLDTADLELHATNDICWDEIVSIEELGEQDVYDATVMGTHNFIANGIATHNSIEQDADVVILLHRDDYYDKESPRAGEADFIVAKHRNGPTDTVTVAAQLHLSRFVDMAIV
jgi:replicative DNA helicase